MLKKLFAQTFVYGLATVLPRMLSFWLLPLYTGVLATAGFGEVTVIFSWFVLFNVVLAYGMETAFFRFYNGAAQPQQVVATALTALLGSSLLFYVLASNSLPFLATLTEIDPAYLQYAIGIMALDALVVIPFAKLRAQGKPMRYALLKTANVGLNLGLNLFFLLGLPWLATVPEAPQEFDFLLKLYRPNFEISYIFIANLVASASSLLFLIGSYKALFAGFDFSLFKRMLRYGFPVMIAGIAFTINEVFDKILLAKLLPSDIAASELGKYAACYKLALFMTLFATAFRLGVEPFFFSHAKSATPQKAYALISRYFVLFGSVIFLGVLVFADVLKELLIRNPDYWEAMQVVPLILLASFFLGTYHSLSVWYKVTDQTHYGAYISIGGAVLTVLINFFGIPIFGYFAAAVATLVAYGSMMVASFIIGRKKYPIPYALGPMAGYLFPALLLGFAAFYLFPGQLAWGLGFFGTYLIILAYFEFKHLKELFYDRSNHQ
ncbi:MAG: polysaccharide biosynthesis C-terminal domain-containing protein [Flavobacteriia bacterium]|nr:polysaccharide biosynthesis C-terminal domain-containing protein [Flavobacteriia bacterium]